jgi:hypothetical protein
VTAAAAALAVPKIAETMLPKTLMVLSSLLNSKTDRVERRIDFNFIWIAGASKARPFHKTASLQLCWQAEYKLNCDAV